MKRTIALFCALALCTTITVPSSVIAADTGTVNASLNANNSLMEQAFSGFSLDSSTNNRQIEISLNPESATVEISGDINATLAGSVDEVLCDDGSVGYVGVYDGHLSDEIPIIADIVYNEENVFAALTLGTLGDESFDLTFYGEFTDSLKVISNKHAEDIAEYREIEASANSQNELTPTPYVQGQTIYQDRDSAYADNSYEYEIGSLSLFFPDELTNQGVMTVFAKVNTNCEGVDNYLVNEQGYQSSIVVYPDTFNISIRGNHDNLHATTNSYLPEEGSTSSNLIIPYYAGSVIGFQVIEIPITMSSTDVTTSRYSSDSFYTNNEISWEIYKRNGWSPWETDGDYESEAGMCVSSDYTYGGNLSSSYTTSMRAEASIRYEYQYFVAGSSMTLHLWTDTMVASSSIRILP